MTAAQLRFLELLEQECDNRRIEVPEEIRDQIRSAQYLSREEASELIDALKFELGWTE